MELITIAVPYTIERKRGAYSTNDTSGRKIYSRVTVEEDELIRRAADKLGLSRAMFMRSAAINTANAIIEDESCS